MAGRVNKATLGLGGVYNKALSYLPPSLAGRIDFLRPQLHAGWGGPLNGQEERQQFVRDLYRVIDFKNTVETGTFRGHSTQFFAALTRNTVHGVENNGRFVDFAQRKNAGNPNVVFHHQDSRSFLRTNVGSLEGPVFYYLDAHWYTDLPLAEEVGMIAASGTPSVILIDDFEVPGDPGYEFDDYGPVVGRLDLALLSDSGIDDWAAFFPTATSKEETGLKRGSVVLASPTLIDQVASVAGLRRHEATTA